MSHVYTITDSARIPSSPRSPKTPVKIPKPSNPLDRIKATNHTSGKFRPAHVPSSPSKRKAVDMMDSEEEDGHTVARSQNGITRTSTPNGKRHRKRARMSTGVAHGQKGEDLLQQRIALPIWTGRETLVREVTENDTVVVLGETGSGKTTQVPQFLFEAKFATNGIIACTQPRRVAATSLAARVAAEQNVSLGSRVGYAVRFDERSTPETKIKYLTDGMLVRELLGDPLLSKYSVVVVDEAHERTLRTDFLLATLKGIQKKRNTQTGHSGKLSTQRPNPLKIVIMSATLDAERFSLYYDNAKILNIKGRQHPVKILYTAQPQEDFAEAALKTFFQVHVEQPPGDVLIFLPGQDEIESLQQSIRTYANELLPDKLQVVVCPMYASLAPHLQNRVFAPTPPNSRKCILATNIAETSITIPGVKYIIDTGFCKEKSYIARDRGSAIESLITQPISKSSARQRAGRAGRLGEGICFRLYTESAYDRLQDAAIPEIQRCNLASAVLQLKCLGQEPGEVDFMDPPDPDYIKVSLLNLFGLGALDKKGVLTPIGRQMSDLPLDPSYARSLLASQQNGCTREVLSIISLMSASSKLFLDSSESREAAHAARQKFVHTSGDHLTYLNVVRAYRDIAQHEAAAARREWCRTHFVNERAVKEAGEIMEQLKGVCNKIGVDWRASCGDEVEPVLKSLVRGLFQNVALLHPDGQYRQVQGRTTVKIHPGSSMVSRKAPCIFYEELVFTLQTYARGVSSISYEFIAELPSYRTRSV
ncbi:P-loop containing nucleoside triphosphate hydrolase protein [Gautieria morchelliformis]|nr:P-loop containing nucleoside triphosphate hydrolase protein [Gautieria morchelliformis]